MRARRVISAVLLLSTAVAFAGEGSATYLDAAGFYRVTATISDPEGEVGAEHFDSIAFSIPGGSSTDRRTLEATSESASKIAPRGTVKVRGTTERDGSFVVDWSGIRVDLAIEQVSACTAGLVVDVSGFVSRDESFFVQILNNMASVSVVSNLTKKSDADLYVYDGVGNLVCFSELPKSAKIADQCGYLSQTCDQTDTSWVEVYGFSKKNQFHLAVWFANAI